MSGNSTIRIMTVGDHPLLREGIAAVILAQPDMTLAAEASTGEEAIQRFQEHAPDVTLMDLRMQDLSGIDAMIAIRGQQPNARIIILSTFEGDVEIARALEAGARASLLKNTSPRELADVIRRVHAGKKRIPAEVASRLAGHVGDDALTPVRLTCSSTLLEGTGIAI